MGAPERHGRSTSVSGNLQPFPRVTQWVEWPGGLSPPGSPRTVREPLDSYGSRLCLVHGLLPSPDGFSWPMALAEQRSPLAPAPLQSLRHYYGLLRPCAPLRYSRPRGWSRLWLVP